MEGLKALGYNVSVKLTKQPTKEDVLLLWNRNGIRHEYAKQYEAVNAKVLVAENGWIGKTRNGGKFYSLSLGWHNGLGQWHCGEESRFEKLNVSLDPWRKSGEHILVLPSRGIGAPGVGMPRDWPITIAQRLQKMTKRRIKIRPHPGDKNSDLSGDLFNAHCVVTWGSGAGIKAIAAGVPVFYELKNWIGKGAAKIFGSDIENPFLGDRMRMFERLAWASWTADEIASGLPFRYLLEMNND